jgi:hypothetical protein
MERMAETGKQKNLVNPSILPADYVPAEQNLETLGYFSARHKRRYPVDRQTSKVVTISSSRRIEIIPSGKYGFPNSEDLDFYRAFLKICDEQATIVREERDGRVSYHPRLPSPLGFGTRELIAKAGREKSAREIIAVREWIERLNSTVIHGELFDAKRQQFNAKIGLEPIFRRFVHFGHQMDTGEIATMNYVWLADWFLDNYFYHYVRPVDLKLHQRLTRPIAKALYPVLDNGWYAANGGPYTKRYQDLCTLLDIQVFQQMSRVQQQLDPSHEELVREEFLGSYEYVQDDQGKWTGMIRCCPGPKWFWDQEQKKQRKYVSILGVGDPSAKDTVTSDLNLTNSEYNYISDAQNHGDISVKRAEHVTDFYKKLGFERVSRQKIEAGIRVIADLVDTQRYLPEDVDSAIEWTVKNKDKFKKEVYSLNVLPHIIEHALAEKRKQTTRESRDQSAQRGITIAQGSNQQGQSETQLDGLTSQERSVLRERAISSLIAQGVKKPFIEMESLLRSEMLYLLSADSKMRNG